MFHKYDYIGNVFLTNTNTNARDALSTSMALPLHVTGMYGSYYCGSVWFRGVSYVLKQSWLRLYRG